MIEDDQLPPDIDAAFCFEEAPMDRERAERAQAAAITAGLLMVAAAIIWGMWS